MKLEIAGVAPYRAVTTYTATHQDITTDGSAHDAERTTVGDSTPGQESDELKAQVSRRDLSHSYSPAMWVAVEAKALHLAMMSIDPESDESESTRKTSRQYQDARTSRRERLGVRENKISSSRRVSKPYKASPKSHTCTFRVPNAPP
jgi:hypothetical protein